MKTSLKSKVGISVGLIIIIFMDVRYLWLHYDMSEAITWTIIGSLVTAFSWLYDKIIKNSIVLESVESELADLEHEFKKIKSIQEGENETDKNKQYRRD